MEYVYILFICIVLFFAFAYYQNNKIDTTEYKIETEKSICKTVVHLSDFHSKPAKNVLKKVRSLSPDVICITGDFINDKNRKRRQMLDYAKELRAIADVVYIPGNHERRLADFDALMQSLTDCGFIVLTDKICTVQDITFLGLDENQADFSDYKARKNGTYIYRDSSALFHKLEESEHFKIVLSHFPENFEYVKENHYAQYDFDLQLSGHAHGGQWILPLIGPVFSPGQGLRPKYARGAFGNRPKLIVSRGIGNAEFPLRLFNHPEIIVLHIHGQTQPSISKK